MRYITGVYRAHADHRRDHSRLRDQARNRTRQLRANVIRTNFSNGLSDVCRGWYLTGDGRNAGTFGNT